MSRITGTAGFGEFSDYNAVDFNIDSGDVEVEYIPAVSHDEAVLTEVPEGADPDAMDVEGHKLYGIPLVGIEGVVLTRRVVDTPSRMETLEEALTRVLREAITVDEIQKSGTDELSITVDYVIRGSVSLELVSYELENFDYFGETPPDGLDSTLVHEALEGYIEEAIADDVKVFGRYDWDVDVRIESAS
ncbi:MAG: hypothetical protein V4510_13055 [bacterium]